MGLVDCMILALIALIIGGAAAYIIRAKRKGRRCIGCPNSCSCSAKGKQRCGGGCHAEKEGS